ncbi:MAG: ABC transporter permease subunit [Gammaproteobacteria bacterium]|nr:ABC transporter permease subunit [Gammaproteobacteria bacterium]
MGPLWLLLFRLAPPSWSDYVIKHWSGRGFVVAVPYLWLLLFFTAPFLIVLKISFSERLIAMPPYEPLFGWVDDIPVVLEWSFSSVMAFLSSIEVYADLDKYEFLLKNTLYIESYVYSIWVAAVSAFWCLMIGYPMAYAMARCTPTWRNVLLLLVMLPSFTSFLLRVYAWMGLLKSNGVINNVLLALGIIDEPLTMMNTDFAVYIGIVYSYLPFMILPLYTNLEKHDPTLLEAAADLGARPVKAFLTVTLPLSMSGIVAGFLLVFIPAVGEYVIPSLLGPTDQLMIGRVLSDEFFNNGDWPVASAVAVVMLVLLVGPIMAFQYFQSRGAEEERK